MRLPIIAGNWKMYKTDEESVNLVKTLKAELSKPLGIEVVVCKTFTSLDSVGETLAGTPVGLGAQNLHCE